MYGPPPNCKRFEVGRVLLNPSVPGDAFECPGFPTRGWTVVSSSSLLRRPFGITLEAVVVAVEKWKAFWAFQAQRLYHGHQAAAPCRG